MQPLDQMICNGQASKSLKRLEHPADSNLRPIDYEKQKTASQYIRTSKTGEKMNS
jgi:hypothetical protein